MPTYDLLDLSRRVIEHTITNLALAIDAIEGCSSEGSASEMLAAGPDPHGYHFVAFTDPALSIEAAQFRQACRQGTEFGDAQARVFRIVRLLAALQRALHERENDLPFVRQKLIELLARTVDLGAIRLGGPGVFDDMPAESGP